MKTSELMIGDWVYNKHHKKNIQITPYDFFTHGHLPSGRQYFIGEPELVSGKDLEPIHLTTEILEKNGWVYNNEDEKFFPQTWVGGGLMLQGSDDCGYCIVVTSDYDDEDTNNTPFIILYVHELQHALMLRGIKKEIIL